MTLPDDVAAAIVNHAREAAPDECCGLLLGNTERLTASVRARNVAPDPARRYVVDPHDHLTAIRLARARGEQVVGAYHSHPRSAPVPSATDVAQAFSNFLFVIVGLAADPPDLRAWAFAGGNFTAVPLVRVP